MRTPQLLATGTATINMTPMIDVVFLLIIFFLVSSHLAKQENAVQLDLPEAVSGIDLTSPRESLVVNVLPSGTWQIGGVNMDRAAFSQAVRRRIMASNEPIQLKIRTDRHISYQRVEPLLQIASAHGVGDIVFSVYEERRR